MAKSDLTKLKTKKSSKQISEVLRDYKIVRLSREISTLGRKDVHNGKAKFGIFGDGKELAQVALARFFKPGDFRSGYYRDQTLMLAIDGLTAQQFFAQLYAHPDISADPNSGGRQMNAHFSSRLLDEAGNWLPQTATRNTSSDMSPTSSQMTRSLGLAQASKVYRNYKELEERPDFSLNGNEIVFSTIGEASTTEGAFWETVNAAGVMQVPLVISVWDDGFGISVPRYLQTTKDSISKALKGMQRTKKEPGIEIFTVKGWDYPSLLETYEEATELSRKEHIPCLVHVDEVTQPQGHSSSGSHERYKSEERMGWEQEYCCCEMFRKWILEEGFTDEETLLQIEEDARVEAKEGREKAWKAFQQPIREERTVLVSLLDDLILVSPADGKILELKQRLQRTQTPLRRDLMATARRALRHVRDDESNARQLLIDWVKRSERENRKKYNSHLYSESESSPMNVTVRKPEYDKNSSLVDGRIILRDNFDKLFETHPELLIFGEDVGKLGDVNLGLEGLQAKHGTIRITDTGIREATILGQGIGLALRGFRPIAEVQYLDYLLYCLQGMSDDLATLRYRTAAGQAAPLIVRTRGHRLEGIWHSGSPMGMIVNSIRGVHLCVPRNLTDTAGFYNTLLQGDDPALVIEPLNAYRIKERMPVNLGEFTTPLGVPDIVSAGSDITVVSYGPTCNMAESLLSNFDQFGISVELIDVKTLLPFDVNRVILESLKKTNRILFVDEDVPGGGTAYMMQQVIDAHGGFHYLDTPAKCLSAKAHRPAYGSDGDYFSKPSKDDIFEAVYTIMNDADPVRYPAIY